MLQQRRKHGTKVKPVLAGGAVVTREHPTRGTEVIVIHRARYNDWTLPKGKTEAGESIPASAVREVWEESGVKVRLGLPLDRICYQSGKQGFKQVDYWGGTVIETSRRAPDDEVDVVSWLPVRVALSRLTFAHDHFLVQQYVEQPTTTPFVIVRHAKAMDRKDWSKKDAARPINSRGRRQAGLLVPMLEAYGITSLVSSTSSRCVGTLIPYARSHELEIQRHDKLSEEEGVDDPKGVAKLIRKIRSDALVAGQPIALCVHRPVLPHVLEAMEMAPTTLVTGEFLVAHLTPDGTVHALERHRPLA